MHELVLKMSNMYICKPSMSYLKKMKYTILIWDLYQSMDLLSKVVVSDGEMILYFLIVPYFLYVFKCLEDNFALKLGPEEYIIYLLNSLTLNLKTK